MKKAHSEIGTLFISAPSQPKYIEPGGSPVLVALILWNHFLAICYYGRAKRLPNGKAKVAWWGDGS